MDNSGFFSVSGHAHGMRELRRELRRAGGDMSELKDANRAAAQIVIPVAMAMAPKRTMALTESIRVGATQRAGIVRAGKKLVPYAGPIHWGWPARGIEPHPWISEAAQKTEEAWQVAYQAHIEKILRKLDRKF